MYKIFVIGVSEPTLTGHQRTLLEKSALLVATRRLRDLATDFPGKTRNVTPLDETIKTIRLMLCKGNITVLASGDPLFYGIGKRLLSEFPSEQVEIYPALSAVQQAAALFKTNWDDAVILTLHGRKQHHLPGLLLCNYKTVIFTDQTNSPTALAAKILEYLKLIDNTALCTTITVSVAENIGLESEKIFTGSLEEAAATDFSPLNILYLQKKIQGTTGQQLFDFGLREEEIIHSRGLITKNEVRAITLHSLQLPRTGIFWDVGGGSGSLSIEAARCNPRLTVYTIEHKEEELTNIKTNICRYGCFNVIPVSGRAPEMLKDLPDPDCVFIGGSSGSLPDIVQVVGERLRKNGRLVINGVIEKTIQTAPQFMRNSGFAVTESVVSIKRTAPNGKSQQLNPITVMTGTR